MPPWSAGSAFRAGSGRTPAGLDFRDRRRRRVPPPLGRHGGRPARGLCRADPAARRLPGRSRVLQPRAPGRTDPAILEMMGSLGTQIGQFIERHQMRARVVQSEKLASLGMLSAGVAHEINNPLAYVANNLAVLERDVPLLARRCWRCTRRPSDEPGGRPARACIQQIDQLAAEFDLAYVQENMGKILRARGRESSGWPTSCRTSAALPASTAPSVDQADIHEAISTALEMFRGRLDRRGSAVERAFGRAPPGRRLARAAQSGFLEPAGQRHAGDRVDPPRRRPDRDHDRLGERRDRRRGGRQRLRDPRRDPSPDLRLRSSRPRRSATAPDWA